MKFGGEKKEKLEKLEKKLYSRGAPSVLDAGRSEFKNDTKSAPDLKENWQDSQKNNFDELAMKVSNMARNKHSFVKKIFILSILFFVAAAGVAAFVFFGGVNLVSSRNVDIKVSGPITIGGGQEISLDINIINNNNTNLNNVSLLVEYPEGTRSAANLSEELSQEKFALETIKSGDSYSQNIKAVFFGEKDTVKELKISLEYRVENSSALFYKEKAHELTISSAPIIITPTYPKEVNSGQNFDFNIEIASNSKDKISDFLVNVEYPFGFVFADGSPSPSYGNDIWRFSNITPGEKRTISIKGSIIGQDNEERVFKVSAGTADENDERRIAVAFSDLLESIMVKKPFIGLDVLVGGSKGDFSAQGGKQVMTELTITNNLPSRLFDTNVKVSLRGGAFDRLSVQPGNDGFFQSSDNTIFWDKRTVIEFSDMAPGSEKKLYFRLSPLLYASIPRGSKPEVEIIVTVSGERVLESGSVEKVSATETRKIVLATDLNLNAKIVRSTGNIENSGPLPPKADVATTYTSIWSLSNTFNQMSNVEVRATLPAYVKWTEIKVPQNEILTFNQVTNEIVWNAGSVLPNTGFGSSQKEVQFQLEFMPSTSQIGQSPLLLGEISVSGVDKVTGQKIEFKLPGLSANFYGDPGYRQGDDKVTQ